MRIKRFFSRSIVVVLILALCSSLCVTGMAKDYTLETVSYDAVYRQSTARETINEINDFRTSDTWYWNIDGTKKEISGLSALVWDYDLEAAAMQRAAELAIYCPFDEDGSMSHVEPNGEVSYFILNRMGYSWTSMSECIAAGSNGCVTAKDVINLLEEENENYSGQGHRRILLDSTYTNVGAACVYMNGCYYWAFEFTQTSGNPNTSNPTSVVDGPKSVSIDITSTRVDYKVNTSDVKDIELNSVDSEPVTVPTITIDLNPGYPANAEYISTVCKSITWESLDTSVIQIQNGKIKAVGAGTGTVSTTVFGNTVSFDVTVDGNAENHNFKGPVFEWTKEYGRYTCKALFTCEECGGVRTVYATITSDTTATCSKAGETTYTAIVDFDGKTYTDKVTEETSALGHEWSTPVFSWSDDYSAATATRTCQRDGCGESETVTATVSSEKVDPTSVKSGSVTYTAKAVFNGKTYSDTKTEVIPATGKQTAGFVRENGKWCYYNENGFQVMNGIVQDTKKVVDGTDGWFYIVNGAVDFNYTGVSNFANDYGWWYIKNGKVDFSCNSVEKNNYGWWYVVGGKVQFGYTGVTNYPNAYGYWYVKGGKVDFSCNSVEQNQYGWWYVIGGKVNFGYTGVANYANNYGWWYVKDGKVDFGKTSVEQNNYGWWRVVNGKVDFSCNSVEQNQWGWWYIVGGKVQFGYTGVANYANAYGWWYISGGKVDFSKTSVEPNNYGWWRVVNGKVDFSFSGWATNSYGRWYCVGGKVDFSKS